MRPLRWPRLLTFATALGALGAAMLGAPAWALGVLGLAVCIWIAIGMMSPRSGIFARPVLGAPPGGQRVALTFDDGPDPATTRRVLELLDARGQHASFFVIGERVAAHPELAVEIARRGHLLANHSFTHAASTPLWTTSRLAADLRRTQDTIEQAAGVRPAWFRPPIGLFGPRVESAARRVGLRLVGWTLRSNDGSAPIFGYDAARVLARVLGRLRDGDVVVLHDRELTLEVLPPLLDALAERGLRSVTLDELFASE